MSIDDDMKVKGVHWEVESDFKTIKKLACFEHNDCCEYIIFIGSDEHIDDLSKDELTKEAYKEIVKASKEGWKYICFYA